VQAVLRETIKRSAPKVVLAVGPFASAIVSSVAPTGVDVLSMPAHGSSGWLAQWQARLHDLSTLSYPTDVARSTWTGAPIQIERADLPYGTLRWQATSGDRAAQASRSAHPSPDYFKLAMPSWASSTAAAPLTTAERNAVDSLKT